jgi:hypothetical protein
MKIRVSITGSDGGTENIDMEVTPISIYLDGQNNIWTIAHSMKQYGFTVDDGNRWVSGDRLLEITKLKENA